MNSLFRPSGSSHRFQLLPAALALVALAGFLLVSSRYLRTGFPLDDAWIHQTYARNLALHHEWSFMPGQPSAGSTAPLWSLLLAGGHLLGSFSQVWAYMLGGVSLAAVALTAENAIRTLMPELDTKIPWMGLFIAGEWHLVWAAGSGMETALHALLILLVIGLVQRKKFDPWLAGALSGLAVWVRPDGMTLMGPVLFVIVFSGNHWKQRVVLALRALATFALFFLPYLLFNRVLAGTWWPNTFFAKQAEYAILLDRSLLQRLVDLLALPMIGPGVLLLPGAVYLFWLAVTQRRWAVLAAFIWWAGYTTLYAVRLPVIYQHGRYLMPAMPVFWLLGLAGSFALGRALTTAKWTWVLRRSWILSIIAVWAAFYGLGAVTYAQDVAIIETEMVATARWVAAHTPPDSYIAAHDIGAMGYFGQRHLLDLAGLVSPEVIPFIRDENHLADYMDACRIDYLVTFPGWYQALDEEGELIFTTEGLYAPRLGGENMAVYAWR